MYTHKNLFLATLILLAFVSCDKSVDVTQVDPYAPIKQNENGGTWKTFLIADPSQIFVALPKLETDASYKAELDSLKKIVLPAVNSSQKASINYWGAGFVYRWNEIARELAAKYNLPPVAKADGTYPVPDPNNPLAEPKFPFANPPYASRAFAYLSIAQYDALVAAWYYKFKYNRKPIHVSDPSVVQGLPQNSLPSYPSEGAVVSSTSYVVLLSMFPGETEYLNTKLAEALNVPLWAGINVKSDIEAGAKLGKAVADVALAKSKTDGMGNANNQAVTAGFIAAAKARGVTKQWESLEVPVRPPLLPNYGAVKTWTFDKATLEKIRPKTPFLVGSPEWEKDLAELKAIDKSQTREQSRIAAYWADGPGTYTPPGHWNRLATDLCLKAKLSEISTARVLAYLNTGVMDAGIACWEAKYYYYAPRPQQFGLKTSVGLPNFPSYTSGHSTFSSAAATILGYMFPSASSELTAKALEASNSRIYGLIHFRVDAEMGLDHGKKIGELVIQRAKSDGFEL
jgi:hypothetical protein